MARCFLTGATGFIGGRLARQLSDAGHEVMAVVREPARARDLAARGVVLSKGDVADPDSLRSAMEGADVVFHVAGWYQLGARDPSEGYRVNVEGTRNVLALMQALKIPRGVYTSTVAVFSDTHGKRVDESYRFEGVHLSEYDRTKAVAHYQIADRFIAQGLPLTIVLPGLVYGPGDPSLVGATLRQVIQKKLPAMPSGVAFCWGHVDDIAGAHLLAWEKGAPGRSYIVAGPCHPLTDALALAARTAGVPAPRVVAPGLLRSLAAPMALIERIVPVPAMYSSENLRVLGGVTYLGDNVRAREELGYAPRALEEGLPETIRHEMRALGLPASS